MRYADLKRERDEAIARAVEAERLSMRSEVDRIRAEAEVEKEALRQELQRECSSAAGMQMRLRDIAAECQCLSAELVALAETIRNP